MSFHNLKLAPSQQQMLHHLRKRGEVSRGALGELAGLSSGAVTRFGRQLIDMGLVLEQKATKEPGPGRPTQCLALRPEGGMSAGFAVHPGWIEAVCLDFSGAEIRHERVRFDVLTPDRLLAVQRSFLSDLPQSNGAHARLGVGVALPGYVTHNPQRRHTVTGLEAWRDLDVPAVLEDELGIPTIVENDASAAALAEYYAPGCASCSVVMSITLGPGVGGGVVIDGQLLRGSHGNAGEIGWLYPYTEPRPSANDFCASMASAGWHQTLFDWVDGAADQHHEHWKEWSKRAGSQLVRAVNAGGGWIDPNRIVLTGPLPLGVLAHTADVLAREPLFEREENIVRPRPQGSSFGAKAAAIGAAQLVFHALSFTDQAA